MTVSEARQIAIDFLGPNVCLNYRGVNQWHCYYKINLEEDHHVFEYHYENEFRVGSDRHIGVEIIDNPIGFNNRCTIMDFGE
ncbi:MAG: hypothetical protein M0P27_05050 [Bacteroidales bacterium]|nr:hypothetical protein [Bacteroidales bacterium]